jgi:hypothetical protein
LVVVERGCASAGCGEGPPGRRGSESSIRVGSRSDRGSGSSHSEWMGQVHRRLPSRGLLTFGRSIGTQG